MGKQERREGMREQAAPSRIGAILKQTTSLTEEALAHCLTLQSEGEPHRRLGQILIEEALAGDDDIAAALARQFGYAFLDHLPKEGIERGATQKLPIEFLKKHNILPFEDQNGRLSVAVADPLDMLAIDSVVTRFGGRCEKCVCTASIVEEGLSHYHFQDGSAQPDAVTSLAAEGQSPDTDEDTDTSDLLGADGGAPAIRLVNKFLFLATQARASDIHIEPYEQEIRIRFRIDGVLHTHSKLPKRLAPSLVSRVKIMAKLNIAERRLPQDGRSRIKIGDRELDVRVSTIPTSGGERVVLRLLDESGAEFSLGQLGFEADTERQFSKLIHRPHGIVLLTGPTGSGKTTTLYGALTELNSDSRNILTVEDPIEYQLPGIGQMQIKPKIGLTFAACLRHILRQDPDVIMVGEIRDLETARTAIQSALTGHLVLSTLHTNDSASAVTRLIDMGIEPYLVCSAVLAIMAQRLVRRVCSECQSDLDDVTDKDKDTGAPLSQLGNEGAVCAVCSGTGFRGRLGIFELLPIDDDIREIILGDHRAHVLKQAAIDKGMRTLRLDGMEKVARGETTENEVFRVTQDDTGE